MSCVDKLKVSEPEMYEYLKSRSGGDYAPETKSAWIKAAKDLREEYLNQVHDILHQAEVKGYEQPSKPVISEKVKNKLSQLKSKNNARTQSAAASNQAGVQQSSEPEHARTEQAGSEGKEQGTANSDSYKRSEIKKEQIETLSNSASSDEMMKSSVFAMLKNTKVFDSVVGHIPVDMMNVLRREQITPDKFFSNHSVFSNSFKSSIESDISGRINDAITIGVANTRAKFLSGLLSGHMELAPAEKALFDDRSAFSTLFGRTNEWSDSKAIINAIQSIASMTAGLSRLRSIGLDPETGITNWTDFFDKFHESVLINEDTENRHIGSEGRQEEVKPEEGAVGKAAPLTEEKEKEPVSNKMPFDEFKEKVLLMAEGMKDSKFEWRISLTDMPQVQREKAVSDIRKGKETIASKKLLDHIQSMYDEGIISMNRGRGGQAQSHNFPLVEWFGEPLTPEELNASQNEKLFDDKSVTIINEEGITKDNIDNLKYLFNESEFPYSKQDFADIKAYLSGQGESNAEGEKGSEGGKSKQELKTEDAGTGNVAPPEDENLFQVQQPQTSDVEEMKDVILDLINEGTTSLKQIENLVAEELGEEMRPLVKEAYNEATKEVKLADTNEKGQPIKNELTTGFAKRINSFIDSIFGKSTSERTVVLKDTQALIDKAAELGNVDYMFREAIIGAAVMLSPMTVKDSKVVKTEQTSKSISKDESAVIEILKNYYKENDETPPQEVIDRALYLWDKFGRPEIAGDSTGKNDRAFALRGEKIKLGNITNFDDFIAELAHAAQYVSGKNLDDKQYATEVERDNIEYNRKGSTEYNAHKLIEPKLAAYIFSGDSSKLNNISYQKTEKQILGFTHKGRVYLNAEHLNPNTPVHEAGHIWTEWAKDNDEKLYNRGIELISNSSYLAKVKENSFYKSEAEKLPKDQREEYYAHEALAAAIGDKGAQFITEAKRKSFVEWARDLWDKIGKALGFKGVTADQVQNMSFDDFMQRAAVDILKGQPQKITEEQQQQPEEEFEEPALRKFTKQVLTDEAIIPKGEIANKLVYVRQSNAMSIEEATDIINQIGVDAAWDLVVHDKELNGAVRSVLGQMLIRKFNNLAANATDNETRDYYIDKTVEAADYVTEKLATEAGQQIQAFKLYALLSPEAQLRSAIKDIKKQAEKRKQKRAKDLLVFARKLNAINEETANEIIDSAKLDEVVENTKKSRVERAEDKIQKARYRRQKILDQHKADKGKVLYSAAPGLTKEGIEFVGNLAKTYIDEGLANLEVIAGKIINHLQDVTGRNVDAIASGNIRDIVQPLIEKVENERITEGLRDLEGEIHRIIREHYTIGGETKSDLIDKFMEQADLENKDANELANSVQEEFDKIATRKKQELFEKDKNRFERIKKGLAGGKTVEPRTLEDEIIRLSNLGTVDNETLLKILADKLGTGKLSPQQGQRILFLAERIKNAPEGSPKREATEDLLVYRAILKGIQWGELAQAVWYAYVLSGYLTHIKNIVSTFFNGISFLTVKAIGDPLSLPFLLYGAGKGLNRGRIEGAHTVATGRSPIHVYKVETPNILEQLNFKGGYLNPANYLKYVGRLMVAEDVLQFQGLKEMRATQLAYREARAEGHRNPFSKATWEVVNEKLLNTPERLEEANEQVKEEGLTGRDAKRRIFELMELSRPIQMTNDAYGFAAKGTFNHDTEGTLGALTDGISRMIDSTLSVGSFKPLRLIVPFTRIITNVANNAIDFSPLGFVRSEVGRRGLLASEASGKRREMTPEEIKDTRIKASLGILSMAALYGLARLGTIAISGAGPDDLKKRMQLIEEGWQPYSIKIGGKWFSYKLTPMVFAWGIVGNMRDNEEYGKADQTAMQKLALTTYDGVHLISDMTWINSAAPVMSAISSSTSPGEAGAILENSGKNIVKGFLIPNAFTQAAERAEQIFNVPTKQANNMYENLIMNVPIARNTLNDKINALGDPIVKDVDILMSTETHDPVWKFLLDHKGWVAPANKGTLIVYDYTTRQERPISNDEYYTFSKSRGQKMRSAIQNIMQNGVMTKIVDGEEKFTIKPDEARGLRSAAELNTKELNKVLTLYEKQATVDTKKELNYYPPDEK